MLTIIDIDEQVVPAHDPAFCIANREASRLEPAIFAISTAEAMYLSISYPLLEISLYRVLPTMQQRELSRPHKEMTTSLSVVRRPRQNSPPIFPIDQLDLSCCVHGPDEARNDINDNAQLSSLARRTSSTRSKSRYRSASDTSEARAPQYSAPAVRANGTTGVTVPNAVGADRFRKDPHLVTASRLRSSSRRAEDASGWTASG